MNVTVFAVTDTHIAMRKPLRVVLRIMYRIALRFESVDNQRVLTFQDGERHWLRFFHLRRSIAVLNSDDLSMHQGSKRIQVVYTQNLCYFVCTCVIDCNIHTTLPPVTEHVV